MDRWRMWWLVAVLWLCPLSAYAQDTNGKLRVYLDCNNCFGDFIREEVDIVEYVRDPAEADIHIIVTSSDTASGGVERAVALIGLGRFKGLDFKTRAISQTSDTEDTQRQRLATAITIGLLNYLSSEGVKGGLTVEVEQTAPPGLSGPAVDRWNFWVMSIQGSISAMGEESSRELSFSGELGADRITDDLKVTMGLEIEYEREDFDLDEEEPLRAIRNERDFEALVAPSINDHWSVGGRTSIDSSTFENIAIRTFVAPAVEYNLFPYSQYTRRQLRLGYALGPYYARYREETLYLKMSDAMAQQQASVTLDQREQWGSLQAELEVLVVYPGPVALSHPARGRYQRAAGPGPVVDVRRIDRQAARSAFDPAPRRHRRGSAAETARAAHGV